MGNEVNRERLLRISEVSAWLGISENTLRYWRTKNLGPTSGKLGSHVVYRETEVQAWIDAQFANAG